MKNKYCDIYHAIECEDGEIKSISINLTGNVNTLIDLFIKNPLESVLFKSIQEIAENAVANRKESSRYTFN